jgi:hypothetical protein
MIRYPKDDNMTNTEIIRVAFRVWGRHLYQSNRLAELALELSGTKHAFHRYFRRKDALALEEKLYLTFIYLVNYLSALPEIPISPTCSIKFGARSDNLSAHNATAFLRNELVSIQNEPHDVLNIARHVQNMTLDVQNTVFHVQNMVLDVNNTAFHVQNLALDVNNMARHAQNMALDVNNMACHVLNMVFDVLNMARYAQSIDSHLRSKPASLWDEPASLRDEIKLIRGELGGERRKILFYRSKKADSKCVEIRPKRLYRGALSGSAGKKNCDRRVERLKSKGRG